jgi:hypothetical protein
VHKPCFVKATFNGVVLEGLQEVELTYQERRFLLRSQLSREASAALRAAGVGAPPTLREGSTTAVA